jgi:tetratricopeptide (TPR) repeat protein
MHRTLTATGMALLCGLCCWRSVRLALGITPDSADYHFRLWQAEGEGTGQSAELDRALALSPRYTAAWIARALEAESAGDRGKAEASLLRAVEIDHLYLSRWTLANFYLRAGDLPRFWTWARRAAEMAYDPAALFQLCWRASGDSREILDRAIPDTPHLRRAYLDFLVRTNRLEAAEPLASEISLVADSSDLDRLLRYCDALLARRQVAPVLRVWNALTRRRIIPYGALDPQTGASLTNGELAAVPLQHGFDWRPARVEGAGLSFDTGSSELRLSLSGKQPESCDFVEQYLPVLPNMKYNFHYRRRTRNLAAETGLSWSFLDVRTAGELTAGPVAASPGGWDDRTLTFSTPPGCDLLRIVLRYARPPGSMRAEGGVEFTRFLLERVG